MCQSLKSYWNRRIKYGTLYSEVFSYLRRESSVSSVVRCLNLASYLQRNSCCNKRNSVVSKRKRIWYQSRVCYLVLIPRAPNILKYPDYRTKRHWIFIGAFIVHNKHTQIKIIPVNCVTILDKCNSEVFEAAHFVDIFEKQSPVSRNLVCSVAAWC